MLKDLFTSAAASPANARTLARGHHPKRLDLPLFSYLPRFIDAQPVLLQLSYPSFRRKPESSTARLDRRRSCSC
jgi:hypothetical protein